MKRKSPAVFVRSSYLFVLACAVLPALGLFAVSFRPIAVNAQQEQNMPIISFTENFDGVTAPQLPAGWFSTASGSGVPFRTTTASRDSVPNSVFSPANVFTGLAELFTPSIRVGGSSPKLIFRHSYNLERSPLNYFDGGVLEIKIGNGDFQDIITSGGSFVSGGYDGTLSTGFGNPLEGRMAWSGVSGGGTAPIYITTEINLPPAAYRQLVQFRWRLGTDNVGSRPGWWIDTIQVTNSISGENQNAISIPFSGAASPYPSEINVTNHDGLVSSVQVNLTNFSHSSPDDVDLMLVAPNGRKVILMSDVGGTTPISNLNLSFDDFATASLPDNAPLASGDYKPTNFEPNDDFPAPAPPGAVTGAMLSAFNGTEANGAWKLFLVDDSGENAGNISGGWSISVRTAPNVIAIPLIGTAQPYPSQITISGREGSVTKAVVNLTNFSHTAPDDVDIMLVAPNGRRIVLMSDVGGNTEVGNLNLVFDDSAASDLPDDAPLASGTFKPTDFETGDSFPAPAPTGAPTGTTLNAFYGSPASGVWRLFVIDDNGENLGSIAGNWSLDLQTSISACMFSITPSVQAFPITGGNGSFNINMPTGCSWTASTGASFIAITSPASGDANGTITFTVAPNMGGGRTGTINVSNGVQTRTFQVQQESGCPFALAQSVINFGAAGGNGNNAVSAGTICNYQASSNASWINITSAAQSGNGSITFTVAPNASSTARSGTITVGARSFTVNQAVATGKRFDFDGDGRADVSVFRPSNSTWYLHQSANGFTGVSFGIAMDRIVPADYDGDGKTDVAVYRSGTWYINRSQLGFTAVFFGEANDTPIPADYDGDGKADVAVFRPSNGTWYLLQSTAGFTGVAFGVATDSPAPADYDGDGKSDIAVFRDGTWYLQRSTQGFTGVAFGAAGDKPVPNAFVP